MKGFCLYERKCNYDVFMDFVMIRCWFNFNDVSTYR